MFFAGFQKLTLLDFPEKVACTLFTKGCNFLCPFCHNALLVQTPDKTQVYSQEYVLDYLKKRTGILDGVCISGGEPLIHDKLEDFLHQVKSLGYSIKLDTNGSFPHKLKYLVNEKLIDYVAMDIKNSFEKYKLTSGCHTLDISLIEQSIDFLLEGNIDYEFRTTVCHELHTKDDVRAISQRIRKADKYFLQNFVNSGNIIGENLHPVSDDCLNQMLNEARLFIKNAKIRGMA